MFEQIKIWFMSLWEQLRVGNFWDEIVIIALAGIILLHIPFGRWIAIVGLVYAVWSLVSRLKQ